MTAPKKTVAFTDQNVPLKRKRRIASLISKDASHSLPQPPSTKLRVAALMRKQPAMKKAKRKTAYHCPYKFCTKSYDGGAWLSKHIRKEHYEAFPGCKPSGACVFLTNSGNIIRFDEKSREAVADGEEIYSDQIGVNYFCPYEACIFAHAYRQHLFDHIRENHYAELPTIVEFKLPIFKNESKKAIRFDEYSRNALPNREPITVERINGKSEPDWYYCSYKGCNGDDKYTTFASLYKHLRQKHDCKNPVSYQKLIGSVKRIGLKTPTGKTLNLMG